jgi:ubiquinone/menaquinone biosynthesis C-methylase UbiE
MESVEEAARLEAKTDRAVTLRRLEWAGLGPGMRALDAGAGTGAVSRLMSELVGDSGEVVALDFSIDRLKYGQQLAESAPAANVRFVAGDLSALPLCAECFDFVYSQLVFQYLRNPDEVVQGLAKLVRPGGKLVIADVDGYGFFHYPLSPELENALRHLETALSSYFDVFAGRKLYHRFRRAGLQPLRVEMFPYHLYAGPAPEAAVANWELKLKTLRSRAMAVLGGPAQYDGFARQFLDLLRDPDSLTYSVLFMVEWTRPRT